MKVSLIIWIWGLLLINQAVLRLVTEETPCSRYYCFAHQLRINGHQAEQQNGGGGSEPGSQGSLVSTASSAAFFSLGEDDEPVSLSAASSPTKTPTPASAGQISFPYLFYSLSTLT